MRANNTNKMRQFSSLLNEHWKRKQRLKVGLASSSRRRGYARSMSNRLRDQFERARIRTRRKTIMIDVSRAPEKSSQARILHENQPLKVYRRPETNSEPARTTDSSILTVPSSGSPLISIGRAPLITRPSPVTISSLLMILFSLLAIDCVSGQSAAMLQADPRPTIYSGQVSFGLLLSAHSPIGSEISTSASQQVRSLLALPAGSPAVGADREQADAEIDEQLATASSSPTGANSSSAAVANETSQADAQLTSDSVLDEIIDQDRRARSRWRHAHDKRQIFERTGQYRRQQQLQREEAAAAVIRPGAGSRADPQGHCSQVNANALYAGMGAIWASHQANLVGDSHLAIGTYVYDSCNDLDVGQRQSVRIVSNLNAFQQTTCESPRGSPISLTIAHGDNQLRAIQLLTSFRVPVITTKEHFALEDYQQLSGSQKKFLFSTAHSSRHLAVGALRFSKRVVSRSTSSPKLPNHFYRMSSKNGLIVISRNLPARFIGYLMETIPEHVNYEMLQSNQPIDQIRSVEALESILIKKEPSSASPSSSSSASESKPSRVFVDPPSSSAKSTSRAKRDTDSDSSDGGAGEYESGSAESDSGSKMLSPTILMFITPSEAIDLVTRLRNDLAEVSRYYSLIVTTREDISPALKTIFHRGGSRLCSGKAFYTISPKPDDISEFSRYFRDTVQVEGETSDHPLVCEFAKYQSNTKTNTDLDDISTEPVIKAVWSAAAAFKTVHKKECPSHTSIPTTGNTYRAGGASSAGSATSSGGGSLASSAASGGSQSGDLDPVSEGRTMRQSGKSSHSDCMVKMNKNLSNLVQKALKRLDATINSTGLQSLDGFRLKFDDSNELVTNKFSIKYINKECEITEIGQYSGLKGSQLSVDMNTMEKSLESSLPDPWPVTVTPPPALPPVPPATSAPADPASSPSGDAAKDSATTSTDASDAASGGDSSDSAPSERGRQRKPHKVVASESSSDDGAKQSSGGEDEDSTSATGGENDKTSERNEAEVAPKRTSKRSRLGELSSASGRHLEDRRLSRRKLDQAASRKRKQHLMAAPVTAMGGRGIMPGVTDTDEPDGTESSSDRTPSASNSGSQTSSKAALVADQRSTTTSGALLSDSTQPKQVRRLKPFSSLTGSTFKDWLPSGVAFPSLSSTYRPVESAITRNPDQHFLSAHPVSALNQQHDNEQVNPASSSNSDLKSRATTQAPVFSTLPESGGNADLDSPPTRSQGRLTPSPGNGSAGRTLDMAATTESSDYVTLSSISKNVYDNQLAGQQVTPQQHQNTQLDYHYEPAQQVNANHSTTMGPQMMQHSNTFYAELPRPGNYLKDLNSSPVPLSSTTLRSPQISDNLRLSEANQEKRSSANSAESKEGRSALRSHLGWIYSGWFGIIVLGANIVGALLTLYVLTFLLMKNCDGSLDRENQGIRSMHLLAIIVVFFGSTLFIVYPTPGLCLLRSSWHNFALVMLFGTLLLQAMQTRSLSSLGLGGRPNRLNQLLTLLFIIGVQVSFELQRWKYESANYLNFVNQYFGSSSESSQKLLSLSSAVANQFNPLNSFNDQITPVSIQVSEQYQNLLHDYCTQQADDFLQSQFYLCTIVILLVIFSSSTRNSRRLAGASSPSSAHHKLASALTTSGKLVASQHETNLTNLSSSHFQFASNNLDVSNMFMVTMITAPIYFVSIIMHIYGQNSANRDLISSVTMILIAFAALIGIFLPILLQIHRYDSLVADRLPGTLSRPVITQSRLQDGSPGSSSSNAFAMFPEFAPTGLRRPSSTSGDSSSGAGSRRPFADTKESRRNMGAALANLGPSADSLRSMGFYDQERNLANANEPIDPALLNLKLNLSANQVQMSNLDDSHSNQQHNHRQTASTKRTPKGEKRLIMLDVDPCCPRHGVAAARPRSGEQPAPKSGRSRTSHCN